MRGAAAAFVHDPVTQIKHGGTATRHGDWKKAETHLVVDKEGDVGPRRGSCVEFPVRNKKKPSCAQWRRFGDWRC